MKPWQKILLVIVILLLAVLISKKAWPQKRTGVAQLDFEPTWDPITDERIKSLHPQLWGVASSFINRAEKELGIQLRVTDAQRSFSRQAELYAQGRTTPGEVVTNAEPGESFHNYAMAIDVVEIREGEAIWENERWDEIGSLGEDIGWEWGGGWFSFSDRPHFQWNFGYTTDELLALFPDGNTMNYDFSLFI
jgi:hypothetical protein